MDATKVTVQDICGKKHEFPGAYPEVTGSGALLVRKGKEPSSNGWPILAGFGAQDWQRFWVKSDREKAKK